MKLISFTVPCYNSENYMRKCVDSLLRGGDDVEIIIVNDGSHDGTINIAREYEASYPNIVRVIDKENGGHGSGVNAGLAVATGLYYKVVDSDDWVDGAALAELIETIKAHSAAGTLPDLYITDFVYYHAADDTHHVSSYEKKFPVRKICGWEKVKAFKYSHMLLMHALMYKRDKLIESNTVLPEHTFYVDNLFAYKPLPFMKTVYYLDVQLYWYYIGREDQSVNRNNFVKRYPQQIRVMKCMVDSYTWREIKKMPRGLRKYMWHALEVIMMNTIYFTCAENSPDRHVALKDLWQHVKKSDKALYKKLRHRSYAFIVNYLPWGLRRFIMTVGYNILCRKVKLG
ncbi:MAG: glycosyltransferase family 2 protein [Clostridia bacterium]|nr:glycosyltransferase family 2 protein [Clostridia bacterium]